LKKQALRVFANVVVMFGCDTQTVVLSPFRFTLDKTLDEVFCAKFYEM
jgi:hypothetical protein